MLFGGGPDGATGQVPATDVRPLAPRDRVVAELLRGGPSPAAALAERLEVVPAAVRRHLDALAADGLVEVREQRVVGPRRRGRPPRVHALTEAGHRAAELLPGAGVAGGYPDVAVAALRALRTVGGDVAVGAFARERVTPLEHRLRRAVEGADVGGVGRGPAGQDGCGDGRVDAFAAELSAAGYSATAAPGGTGVQVCQHHCPVQAVATEFPELCQAETEVFERVLGTHVSRLATVAAGAGVCTTLVPSSPPPPTAAGPAAPVAAAPPTTDPITATTSGRTP